MTERLVCDQPTSLEVARPPGLRLFARVVRIVSQVEDAEEAALLFAPGCAEARLRCHPALDRGAGIGGGGAATLVKGGISSARLSEEIRTREQRLAEIKELMTRSAAPVAVAAPVDRVWVEAQMRKLADRLATDPLGARREFQKHVEDLRIAPAPEMGPKVVRITGQAKADGLLGGEEAVRLQLVAGAGFEPATFGL